MNSCSILCLVLASIIPCFCMKIRIFRENRLQRSEGNLCSGDVCITPINQTTMGPPRFTRHTPDCNGTLPTNITIELAVFVDHVLYVQFAEKEKDPDAALKDFAYTILYTAKLLIDGDHLDPEINLVLSEFQIWKTKGVKNLQKLRDRKFNMAYYMQNFMQYQKRWKKKIGKSWDHAILLTGFDLSLNGQDRFSGYGTTGSLCMADSCSVVEARNFKAAYTFVHELGHAIGMKHDGQENSCRAGSYLMSPMVVSGSHRFSSCNKEEYRAFLRRLQCNTYLDWCLHRPGNVTANEMNFVMDQTLPGQKEPITAQCRNSFGSCYRPFIKGSYNKSLELVCREVWCSDGSSYINASHAALEGTYCAPGKWCRMGSCVQADRKLRVINGGWSEWSEGPEHGQCKVQGCSKCTIKGQIRVKRRLRTCNNPDPNNGGKSCEGEQYMGKLCKQKACSSGLTVTKYASKICQRIISERPNHTQARHFSGLGLQRLSSDHPCCVWCRLNGSSQIYTFFDHFPDGTPCGPASYCLAGKCMKLSCNDGGIVGNSLFCTQPKHVSSFESTNQKAVTSAKTTDVTSFTPPTSTTLPPPPPPPPPPPHWSGWGAWGSCSKDCAPAFRKRIRHCFIGKQLTRTKKCHGSVAKYQICSNLPHC